MARFILIPAIHRVLCEERGRTEIIGYGSLVCCSSEEI